MVDSIILELKEKGISIVEGFVTEDNLKQLISEFDRALTKTDNGIHHLEYSNGEGAIIRKLECDFKNFPITKQVFYSDRLKKIADTYLNFENELNKDIFIVKDVVGSKHHANDLHFDVAHTFKFFIYLMDTDETNGAFCCVPGSHLRTAKLREELRDNISYENRHLTRKLPYSEEEVISVNGKAGTLIIFDTDVFHRAGIVSEGERKVMRGHTRRSDNHKINPAPKRGFLQKVRRKLFK
jgi:ectoine hydroxylase-related dioxygenase (phytanoyl-CoA dioxygenase family)